VYNAGVAVNTLVCSTSRVFIALKNGTLVVYPTSGNDATRSYRINISKPSFADEKGTTLYYASDNKILKLYTKSHASGPVDVLRTNATITSFSIYGDSAYVSNNGTKVITQWNLRTGKKGREFAILESSPLYFLARERLFTVQPSGLVKIWSLVSGRLDSELLPSVPTSANLTATAVVDGTEHVYIGFNNGLIIGARIPSLSAKVN
jgi:hypothetical protein